MEDVTPELWQTVIQVGGTPALIMVGIYWMWKTGVQDEIRRVTRRVELDVERMATSVDGIRSDLQAHRDAVLAEQQAHRDRLQRLEILAEQAQAEKEGRARRI